VYSLCAVTLLVVASGCGGGGGGGGVPAAGGGAGNQQQVDPAIDTVLSSGTVSPKAGGLVAVDSADDELDGASISLPAGAVDETLTMSIGTIDQLPAGSPFGQQPVGKTFGIEPTGTMFIEEVDLTLPIPPGVAAENLYIGRWNPTEGVWEDLGGTIDGDYISTTIDHLSVYGVFYRGKSRVRVLNSADPTIADLGIELRYVSGPAVPPDVALDSPYPAYRPLPEGGVDLDPGASTTMTLLPGRYHFIVSYPHPQPGVANGLFFTIPRIEEGADDPFIDQTITITLDGAESTDLETTDPSIVFSGARILPGSNVRPIITATAFAPEGVAVVDALDGQAPDNLTRIVNVGPIKVEQLTPLGALTLAGTPHDPENGNLDLFWTFTSGGLPIYEPGASDVEASRGWLPFPLRGGRYTVYLTVYDELGLFDECRWNIEVVPNTKPTIDVVVDDMIIDFGRLDEKRRPLGAAPFSAAAALCSYVDALVIDGIPDTTVLKTLATSPGDHANPDQHPDGMTCIFAIVDDADGDDLSGGFTLPTPLFGRGNFYAALAVPPTDDVPDGLDVGEIIDTYDEMDAYNDYVLSLANAGSLPVTAPLASPSATAQALPIIWEAPDDPDVSGTTHDCVTHIGPPECSIRRGGTVNVLADVTDGFSKEQRDYGTIGFPNRDIFPDNFTIASITPHPADPAPGQSVTVTATIFPAEAGVTVEFSIVGTDGYSNAESVVTDENGQASFFIPGAAEDVVDVVTVRVGETEAEVTYRF